MIKIMSKGHIYKLKVFVEDVDFGRVFYSRYLQYIERARVKYSTKVGVFNKNFQFINVAFGHNFNHKAKVYLIQ